MAKLVYKYRGGDDPIFKRDLNSLEENCFFAPNSDKLNDPCETSVFTDKFDAQSVIFSKFLGDNSKQHLDNVNNALKNVINRKKEVGIYSLSKTYKDELLWAHYANAHYGFCIEYDLDILIDTYKAENIYSFPVTYSNTPPQIGINEVSKSNQGGLSIIKKMLGYKSKRWAYEKEHRLIIDKFGEQAYNHKAVKAIYFGLRMEDEEKEAIMNRFQGRGILYFQMYQKEKSYELEAKPVNDINDTKLTYLKEIPLSITGSSSVKYEIVKKDYDWVSKKGTIEIILELEVSKASLKWLAELIKNHIFKKAERIFMFYYIKGDENAEICWATSHFSVEKIEVSINDFVNT
ncbi:DUF2971 domain-containing protein [archaeon]|nr:DUF2971 domain-containing protein [archaeon]